MSNSSDNSTHQNQRLSSGHPKTLWRNRDYMLLWSGQALSDIGGAVSELAFPLLVLASHDILQHKQDLSRLCVRCQPHFLACSQECWLIAGIASVSCSL